MRKILMLMMIAIILLSACSEENDAEEGKVPDEVTAETENEEKEDDVDEIEEKTEETEEASESSNPSGAQEIFQKAAEVMSGLESVNLTGEIISRTDMMGIVENTTSQINGKVSMQPFAQHLNMNTESDIEGVTESEMFITEEIMYMTDPESGGWLSMSMEHGGMMGDVSAMISEAQLHYFEENHDLFKLTEVSDHYVMMYEGAGEDFKRVVFGAMKDLVGDEAYESMTGMIQEISGKYVFTIDKDTFDIVAMQMDIEQTMDFGVGQMDSTEQISYEYSGFNEVEPVIVPENVVENALSIGLPGGMGAD